MSNLPWDTKTEVNLATNEFVNQFTVNRCLTRLLQNDSILDTLIDEGVATELATDNEAISGIITNKAVTPKQLHFVDNEFVSISGHSDVGFVTNSRTSAGVTTDTYSISGFLGDVDLDNDEVRQLHISTRCKIQTDSGRLAYITVTYPNGSTYNINSMTTAGNDSEWVESLTTPSVPINKDTDEITITLTTNFSNEVEYTIIGVTQRVFQE